MRRKLAIAAVPLALVLAGCSGTSTPVGDKKGTESLKADVKGDDQAPDVTFDKPMNVSEDTVKVLKQGDGDQIKDGDRVMYRLAGYDGNSGQKVNDTYSSKQDSPLIYGAQLQQQSKALFDGLKDQKKGATVAFVPKAQSDQQRGVMVFTITDVQHPPEFKDLKPGEQFGDKTATDKIGVKYGDDTWVPKVSIDKKLQAKAAAARLFGEPKKDGATIQDDSKVTLKTSVIDIASGNQAQDTYSPGSKPTAPTMADLKKEMPVLYQALKGQKEGQTIVYVPKADKGQQASAMVLTVAGVEKYHKPQKLSADQVKKLRSEGALPTIKEQGAKKTPSIEFPEGKKAPQDLVVETVKEGSGPAVKATDSVTATYSGWAWDSHKNFDENFTKKPTSFELDKVIKGWTQGLEGQKVGSTVMLSIPKELAYGEQPQGDAQGDLVFYVKIEKAEAPKKQPAK